MSVRQGDPLYQVIQPFPRGKKKSLHDTCRSMHDPPDLYFKMVESVFDCKASTKMGFFPLQSRIVKPLKLLQTLLTVMWEYTFLGMKSLQKNQKILFGKFSMEIDSSSIPVKTKEDIESVQNRV